MISIVSYNFIIFCFRYINVRRVLQKSQLAIKNCLVYAVEALLVKRSLYIYTLHAFRKSVNVIRVKLAPYKFVCVSACIGVYVRFRVTLHLSIYAIAHVHFTSYNYFMYIT